MNIWETLGVSDELVILMNKQEYAWMFVCHECVIFQEFLHFLRVEPAGLVFGFWILDFEKKNFEANSPDLPLFICLAWFST